MQKLSYDLHIHSCLSPCGDDESTPANIVGMAAVAGLDAIAVADHNTCRNLPTIMKLADAYGVLAVPAMELTTSEEIHVLCYFEELEAALAFNNYVDVHALQIENRPDYFGNQFIMDEEDRIIGEERRFLPLATDISFDDVYELLRPYHGLMVPAHINKSSTSLLAILGVIPENSRFTAAEVQTVDRITDLRSRHPYLEHCHILSSSDAHYLKDIQDPIRFLHVEDRSVKGILEALHKPL